MKRSVPRFFLSFAIVFSLVLLSNCGTNMSGALNTGGTGGNGGNGGSSGQSVAASFNISDTPPMGVSVLRFQIQVTAASMQPSGSGSQPVSMLTAPQTVELIHLQSESALLANISVPAGTYTSLSASFANPQMTILNRSTSTLTAGGQQCAPNTVCTFTPTLNQSSVMDESAPFPITLSSASPVAFLMHFEVNASVQGDLSVSPAISLKELPPLPSGALTNFHIDGRITSVTSPNTFTLSTGLGNVSFTVTTNSSTQYQFGSVCAADTFSCLMVGEVVRVDLNAMPTPTLVATDVELLAVQGAPLLEGTVVGVDSATNQLEVVLTGLQDNTAGMLTSASATFGLQLTIQLANSTTYNIDSDGITLPTSGLSFAGIQDIVVGQTLAIQPGAITITVAGPIPISPTPPMPPPPPINITITASNLRLESSELTATVDTVAPPSFTLDQLPPLFTGATPAITEIDVETVTGTNLENISSVSALAPGNTVSVGGLLFNTANTPTIVAERVMQR